MAGNDGGKKKSMGAAWLLGNMRLICRVRGIYKSRAVYSVARERNGEVLGAAVPHYRIFCTVCVYAVLACVYSVVRSSDAFFLWRTMA